MRSIWVFLICLLFVQNAFAYGVQAYRNDMSYSEPATSFEQYKRQNGITTPVQRTWVDSAFDVTKAMFSAVARAVRAVGRFVADCGRYIAFKVADFFKPLSSPTQQQNPEKKIGYFENVIGVPDFTGSQATSMFNRSELRTIQMTDALVRGQGKQEEAPYRPTLYSHGNGSATVDMPLNWLNPNKVDSGIAHDVAKSKARDDRWEMATSVAAKDIAALVDAKNFKLIEVGGVNVENGLGTAKVAEILQRVHIPENAVLVVGHSAGSHAITKAMSLISRDKAEVYWLLLSPRIPLKQSVEMVKKAGVPMNHVMSINNRNDFIMT